MRYKIVVDSCCDLTDLIKQDPHFQVIPLTLQVGEQTFVDDEAFNQLAYIKAVAESPECAKTACPSPEAFVKAYKSDGEMVFVVTLSQHLSGTYNSAVLGKRLYEEENEDAKPVHVFSSDSACCGESLIAFRIQELAEAGLSFDEIVKQVTEFRDKMLTYFVLESLDTLKKNGRLTGFAALLATTLHIKPIMTAKKGVIIKADQSRGVQKALTKMVGLVLENCREPEKKTLAITHINCPERAEFVKRMFQAAAHFRDIYVVNGAGVSTTYANDGGIVVCI